MPHSDITALTKLLGSYKVFVDTCSFMHTEAPVFFARLTPELERRNAQINIPLSVTAEVVQNKSENRSAQCRSCADAAYKIINELLNKQIAVQIANSSVSSFADHSFELFLESERVDSNLLLITQDRALAKKTAMCNIDAAVRGKKIKVMKINACGGIDDWDTDRLLAELQLDLQETRKKNRAASQGTPICRASRLQTPQSRPCAPIRQARPYAPAPVRQSRAASPAYIATTSTRTTTPPKKQKSRAKSFETCIDCGAAFTVSVDEAKFLLQKGYNFPRRCPACRDARKDKSRGFTGFTYR